MRARDLGIIHPIREGEPVERGRRVGGAEAHRRHDQRHKSAMEKTPACATTRHCPPSLVRGTTPRHVFIDSKNSALFLVFRSLSRRKSIASMVPIGLRM